MTKTTSTTITALLHRGGFLLYNIFVRKEIANEIVS
jgi:hypothetical protein